MKTFILENNIEIKNGMIMYIDFNTRQRINKKFQIDLEDIHKRMCSVEYMKEYQKVKYTKYEEIERISMMPFAYIYYYYFAKNLQIPYPNEFVQTYINMFCYKKQNEKWAFKKEYDITNRDNFEFRYDALKARILRSYNTFNREVELLVKLNKHLTNMEVEYNLYDDLFLGVDLTIYYHNKKVGIAEYVDTARSKMYKVGKNQIHNYDKPMIDVVATFNGENKNVCNYGEVFCYDDNTVQKLERDIKNKVLTNKKKYVILIA